MATNQVVVAFPNNSGGVLSSGELIRITGAKAQANDPANLLGLVGAAQIGALPNVSVPAIVVGDAQVRMEAGLTLAVQDSIYVSASVPGRGTNVAPGSNVRAVGWIKSTTPYVGSGTVAAVLTPLTIPVEAPSGGGVVAAFEFADEAARDAGTGYTLTADDVGKAARQIDAQSFWVLLDHDPIVWTPLVGPATQVLVPGSGEPEVVTIENIGSGGLLPQVMVRSGNFLLGNSQQQLRAGGLWLNDGNDTLLEATAIADAGTVLRDGLTLISRNQLGLMVNPADVSQGAYVAYIDATAPVAVTVNWQGPAHGTKLTIFITAGTAAVTLTFADAVLRIGAASFGTLVMTSTAVDDFVQLRWASAAGGGPFWMLEGFKGTR